MKRFALVFVFCVAIISILTANVWADDCPSCINPSGGACKIWGDGRAYFQWASGEEVDSISSGITLTAGLCDAPGNGETGTGYIFAVVDTHKATCDGDDPCGSGYTPGDYYAIIEITGNKNAFEYIFENGITFVGDCQVTTQSGCKYKRVTVDQANCKYSLQMNGGQIFRMALTPTVGRCSRQYNNSQFNISVKFYQQYDSNYVKLAETSGSITVKQNPKGDFNPITFKPNLEDGNNIGWIETIERDYDEADSDWELTYTGGGFGTCSPVDAYPPYGICATIISDSHTFYRVKYPGWEEPVNDCPDYMTASGWSYNTSKSYIKYDMGDLGAFYFHCDTPFTNEGPSTKYYVSYVEYCEPGKEVDKGERVWTCAYEFNSPAKLKYIYNGYNTTDPNSISEATACYVYTWGGDGNDPNIVYQTRSNTQEEWTEERKWQLEFDSLDRAVKVQGGDCSGCGGSDQFKHIEYYGSTDYISKRYNASNEPIVENTYTTIDYGEIEPIGWLYVKNYSFEAPDVTAGTSSNELPTGWDWIDIENTPNMDIVIYDPNSSDPPHGNQVLRPNGDGIEYTSPARIRENVVYLLEAEVKAISGDSTTGTATISLYSTENLVDDNELLAQFTFLENDDANEGIWWYGGEYWESSGYEVTLGGDFDNDPRFRIEISGDGVEIDKIHLSAAKGSYQTTKPILTQQKTRDSNDNLVVTFQRTIDEENNEMLEKRYTADGEYRLTKLFYADGSFDNLEKRIEYGTLSDSSTDPTGDTFTTTYTVYDPNGHYTTTYPNGKRADYARYEYGNLVESYVIDLVTDVNSLHQYYEYDDLRDPGEEEPSENPYWGLIKEVNPRGGITEYSYQTFTYPGLNTYLLQTQTDPNNAADDQQVITYTYDDAQRVKTQTRKLDSERNLRTTYSYNSDTGFLDSVKVNGATTSFKYNDFGQVTRQTNPDGIMTGKSYGTGGELVSEFMIHKDSDPNNADTSLNLISQTRYTYTADGKIEKVGKYKADGSFSYQQYMTTDPNNWIVTKYEYYKNGRKKKTIEDFGTGRTNLTTEYVYNRQGEVEKILYPTGKWVQTDRDGRGLVVEENVGYGTYPNDIVLVKTAFGYDDNGNLTDHIRPDGSYLVYEYNNYDQLKRTYQGSKSGPYVENFYDDAGDITRVIACESDGAILSDSRTDYDDLGNVTFERLCFEPNSIDNNKDFTSHYEYDIAGNLRFDIKCKLAAAEPNAITTEFRYNNQGRQSIVVDPNGFIYSKYYTDGGLVYKSIDPNDPADPNAYITLNDYDAYGRLEKTTNPEGHYVENTYNSLSQITKQVVYDALDLTNPNDDFPVRQTRTVFNNLGNVTQQTVMADPNESGDVVLGKDLVTKFVFDPNGVLSEQKVYVGSSATAATTTFIYDKIGRRILTTDPEDNTERVYYNTSDSTLGSQVTEIEQYENDPDGANDYTITTFMLYDTNGRLLARILDENGDGDIDTADPNTSFTYDGLNRVTHTTAHDDVVTFTAYDGFGNIKQTIEDYGTGEENRKTEYVYNCLNRQYQVKAYDPNDTATTIQTTEYEYNENGLATKVTYPDNKTAEYAYNLISKVDFATKRDGSKIYYWYDQLGNVIYESDDPDGPDSTSTPGFLTEFTFDGAGQLTYTDKMVGTVLISSSSFAYNGFGAQTSETAQYDANSISKMTSWTYDGAGNKLTQTHGDTTLTFTHDKLGRIKTIDRGNDEIVTYDYIGRNTEAIDYPEADTTQLFAFDDLGRITDCNSVDVNDLSILHFEYTYDEVGNREKCKYNHLESPVYDVYKYDSLRRLEKVTYADEDGVVAMRIDGNPASMENLVLFASAWVNGREVIHNAASEALVAQRLEQMESLLKEAGFRNIDSFLNSVKTVQTFAFNPDEPIYTFAEFGSDVPKNYTTESVLNDNDEIIAQIIWDNKDRIVLFAMYPDSGNTVVASKSYDSKGNLITDTITTFDVDGNVINSTDMLAALQPVLTESSLAMAPMSMAAGSVMMSSEAETPVVKTEEFGYDHLGNRDTVYVTNENNIQTTFEYSHNLTNQYSTVKDTTWGLSSTYQFTHDENGNLTMQYNRAHEEYHNYSYDYRNRLTEVEDSNSVTIAEYAFDSLGRRIYKTVSSETTYFFYDAAGRVIAEYADGTTPTLTREFVYGNGIDEVLAMFTPYNVGDPNDWDDFVDFCAAWLSDPNDTGIWDGNFDNNNDEIINFEDFAYFAGVWDIPSTKESDWYYLRDALGSVRGLVGGRFDREEDREFWNYDVYGKLSIVDGEESKSGNPYLYTGRRYDAETALYYYRTRMFDPDTGRMLQFDRGYFDGMNLYEYVRSNPTNFVDPFGLCGEKPLTMDQILIYLENPGEDEEDISDDTPLCGLEDYLKFKEGRMALALYLAGRGNLSKHFAGCPMIEVELDTFKIQGNEIIKTSPFTLTAGEVREVFKTKELYDSYEPRFKKFVLDLYSQAILTAGVEVVAPAVPVLISFLRATPRGPSMMAKSASFIDEIYRSGCTPTRPTPPPTTTPKPSFYVKPDGTAIPSTGYRAIVGPGAVDEAMGGVISPRPGGTYFTFDDITSMSATEAKSYLQLKRTPSHVVYFDTIHIIDDISVPRMYWNEGLFPEPIIDVYPKWGVGGGTQAITNSPIVSPVVKPLP